MTTEEKIQEATRKFEVEVAKLSNAIAKKADEMSENSDVLADKSVGFSITDSEGKRYNFEWREISFNLPIPHFTMREERISFDVPSITMKTDNIIFNVPAVRMVDKQIGVKPEAKCGWKVGWVLGVKTKKWQCTFWDFPIIISVPEPYSKEVKITLDIPEVRMERKDVIYDIPEITVEMKMIRFNSIVLNDINYPAAESNLEEDEEQIRQEQRKIDLLTDSFREELDNLTIQMATEGFDKAEANIREQMKPHQEKYEQGIRELKESIKILKNNNVIERVQLEENNLKKLIDEMNMFLQPYENSIVELNKSRVTAIEKLKNPVPDSPEAVFS